MGMGAHMDRGSIAMRKNRGGKKNSTQSKGLQRKESAFSHLHGMARNI